jgi:hypothetical protein
MQRDYKGKRTWFPIPEETGSERFKGLYFLKIRSDERTGISLAGIKGNEAWRLLCMGKEMTGKNNIYVLH